MEWILVVVFGVLAAGFGIGLLARNAALNTKEAELVDANREAKRATDKLIAKSAKYDKKASEASTKGSQSKGQKQRLAKLSDEIGKLKADKKKSDDRVKELANDLKRVRIDREEVRSELAAARTRLKDLGQSAAELELLKSKTSQAKQSAEATAQAVSVEADRGSREAVREASKMERELDNAQKSVERLQSAMARVKRQAVERESELRHLRQKNEHNRRAYIITQLQLDLASDENYFLKTGKRPDIAQADKAAKRAALSPEAPKIEVDFDAEPIQLPGTPDPVFEEPELELEPVVEAAPEPEPAAEPEPEVAVAATPEPVAEAEPEVVAAPEPAVPKGDPKVVKRKAKKEAAGDDDAKPVATPPRPKAPPRP